VPTHCSYCHHEYESDPPSQWETLVHLNDCRPLPRQDKPGLFHEAVGVASRYREQRDALAAALRRIERGVDHPRGIDCAPHFYEAVEWAQDIARAALAGLEA
jgi:hypothetical protein